MPEVRMNSFVQQHAGVTGWWTKFFRWEDNPAEDAAFTAYINKAGEAENAVVDRSGSEPILSWTWNGTPHSEPAGPVGSHWHYSYRTNTPEDVYAGNYGDRAVVKFSGVPTGYWECDEYGRPFDLNDLLA